MKLKTNKKCTYLFTKCTYENKITITKKKKIILRVRDIHLLQTTFLISTNGDSVRQNRISIVGD